MVPVCQAGGDNCGKARFGPEVCYVLTDGVDEVVHAENSVPLVLEVVRLLVTATSFPYCDVTETGDKVDVAVRGIIRVFEKTEGLML